MIHALEYELLIFYLEFEEFSISRVVIRNFGNQSNEFFSMNQNGRREDDFKTILNNLKSRNI